MKDIYSLFKIYLYNYVIDYMYFNLNELIVHALSAETGIFFE